MSPEEDQMLSAASSGIVSVTQQNVETVGNNTTTNRTIMSTVECFSSESSDVQHFINKHETNGGIINLMTEYLSELSWLDNVRWSVVYCS